jgi:fructose-bisphosphate aldolase, class I
MFLGKEIRLKRLLGPSGRLLAITVDHPITRGILPGLVDIRTAMRKIVAGRPDAVTMHKGIAEKVFPPYAGQVAMILKTTAYSVHYHPAFDAPVATVDEAVRFGADAVSVGVIVGGPEQAAQLTHLGEMSRQAALAGMPLVAHIYPKGTLSKDPYSADAVAYAVRAGAELGVDIIKTNWTGSAESFKKVVQACPARVALAGGDVGKTLEDYLSLTADALSVGLAGVTYGRFVWEHEHPTAVIRAVAAVLHGGKGVDAALKVYQEAVAQEQAEGTP